MLTGFYVLGKMRKARLSIAWLISGSLFFYAWWNPPYIILLLFSIVFNYGCAKCILGADCGAANRKGFLVAGIVVNLGLLGYFKYANFFVDNLENLTSWQIEWTSIILPIAISFFTFQEIAFLVDTYQGKVGNVKFLEYCLFVTFFPQLIAGPIVHHSEMIPQFRRKTLATFGCSHFSVGLTIFLIGLFKKVVIADGVAVYSTPVFDAARDGVALSLFEAWGGALAYTFQLYFDFSGYSDMAIGLGRLFGFRLPVNFYSPYKASNIIDFWRRWHMTLSRFFRDYLYIPLGGSRKGTLRQYGNLFLTMALVGLWHGAGWTFVIWGCLHGLYLLVNHSWKKIRVGLGLAENWLGVWGRILSRGLTFLCVVVGWVYFRADSMSAAHSVLHSMVGGAGISLPSRLSGNLGALEVWLVQNGISFQGMFVNSLVDWNAFWAYWLPLLLIVVWFAPNTQQIASRYRPAIATYSRLEERLKNSRLEWAPTPVWALAIAILGVWAILSLTQMSEFLYFQF